LREKLFDVLIINCFDVIIIIITINKILITIILVRPVTFELQNQNVKSFFQNKKIQYKISRTVKC